MDVGIGIGKVQGIVEVQMAGIRRFFIMSSIGPLILKLIIRERGDHMSMLLIATLHNPVFDILGHCENAVSSYVVASPTSMATILIGRIAPLKALVIRSKGGDWTSSWRRRR